VGRRSRMLFSCGEIAVFNSPAMAWASSDWMAKYGHPIYLLESFVEQERFRGICYHAANWIYVGQTKGRSRNDRYTTLKVPVKDIYLYPLTKRFRETLSQQVGEQKGRQEEDDK